jgi:hypothetical protein
MKKKSTPGKARSRSPVATHQPNIQKTKKTAENMEIHHPHHVHHDKKWKDHVFEFFMLFLAVTAGFFVENQREHYIEHLREKQYARSLYDDLKIDTAILQRVMDYKAWSSDQMDSLLNILDSPLLPRQNEQIYFYERILTTNDIFTAQDVTYQQLQSSGNFRYIRNKELYKQISDYYNLYQRYLTLIEGSFENPSSLTEMEARLFDGADLASLFNPNSTSINNLFIKPNRKLHPVKYDKDYLNYFYIKISNRHMLLKSSVTWLAWLKDKAIKILIELEREYHFE